ncbi:MAG: hypothetical protein J0H93_01300 [Chlamydiales bacterium]|nr:hypothetical protein [Chlamydiales bacterium]
MLETTAAAKRAAAINKEILRAATTQAAVTVASAIEEKTITVTLRPSKCPFWAVDFAISCGICKSLEEATVLIKLLIIHLLVNMDV